MTVFFVKGEQFAPRTRVVPPGKAAPTVAMQALLVGPTAAERAAGVDTTLPARTKLVSISVRAGTATVNLTRARTMSTAFDVSLRPARAAQIVYTLTSIPTIKQVLIRNARTSHAVLAFQAWQRLSRDGIVGPQTLATLEIAERPKPTSTLGGRRAEVHREKGVTLLVENGRVVRALHSSSGKRAYETPAGSFRIFRKERNSWSVPYQVWLPYASYFNGGIAFHAYPEVPSHPASHGCVRLPVPEAPFAYSFMSIGTRVTVY